MRDEMTITIARLSAVIETIYDAAVDSAHWNGALKLIAGETGSVACTLHFIDMQQQIALESFYTGITKEFIDRILQIERAHV